MGTLSGHPNIVSVIDTGMTSSGRPYIAMPYLREGTLADRLHLEGPLPWAEAVRIAIKLAGALETAHRAGTLHRDVKPENVLLSDYGEPQLTDFGIARVEGRYETGTGQVVASAAHASPEVLEGRAATVASDVYSLGSTLFTVLAGHPPFAREGDEALVALYLRIARDPVPDLRSRGVPDSVCAVVEQAMAKDSRARQNSVAELGRQLQEIQRRAGVPITDMALALPAGSERVGGPLKVASSGSGDGALEAVTDDPSGPVPVLPRPPRRTLVVAAVVLAVGLLGGVVYLASGDDDQASPSTPSTPSTRSTAAAAPPTTMATGPAPEVPGIAVGGEPTSVAVNPRTNRIYVANSGSLNVTVVDGTTKEVVATVPVATRPHSIAVNQRSSRIYVTTAESSIIVINGDSNEVVGSIPLSTRPIGLAIDHRTDRVIVATSEPVVAVVDGPSSRVIATIPLAARPWSVAVIPETNRIYVTSQEAGTLAVVHGASYGVLATVPVGGRPCGVAANPRSRRVYVTNQDTGSVTVLDADANTVVATVPVAAKPCGVAVNSQSSRVYMTDQEAGRVVVFDGIGNQALRAVDTARPVRAPEPLPYGIDVDPQTDGVYVVDRGANRLLTFTGAQL
jgi:YVTN family beta-propeller protein